MVLWFKLEAVALEGSLLGGGSNRQLHKHTHTYTVKSFETLTSARAGLEVYILAECNCTIIYYPWHDISSGLKERVELFSEDGKHCSSSIQP